MRPHPGFALVLALTACATVSQPASRLPGVAATGAAGHLVIVGGGGTPDAVIARAIELAGGSSARGVILAQASSRPEAGSESVAFWKEKGLVDVSSLDLADPAAARELIAEADLLWFPGGDQSRLLRAIDEAEVLPAIRERYASGAVVGGTSAGAAVMSSVMIVGGETADLKVVRAGSVETVEGLGLLAGTIVDQHFLRRQRFNRLLSAVLARPDLIGIGIDERTAIVVTGSRFEVIGEGGVLVLDARGGKVSDSALGAPAAAEGVRLSLLREGTTFDLSAGLSIPPSLP
jgi:cyanophycinase